jgi:hypothetical protein
MAARSPLRRRKTERRAGARLFPNPNKDLLKRP